MDSEDDIEGLTLTLRGATSGDFLGEIEISPAEHVAIIELGLSEVFRRYLQMEKLK
jgi:hypothetical protein